MREGEAGGVEELALEAQAGHAVDPVADDGQLDRGQVDADLVRPAGLEPDPEQRVLRRDLEIKQDIYSSVARSLEEARINEVRDTPLLTIIDRPLPPPRPEQPKPLLNAVLLALVSPLVWLCWILLRLHWMPTTTGVGSGI